MNSNLNSTNKYNLNKQVNITFIKLYTHLLPVTFKTFQTYQTSTFWGYTQLPYLSGGFLSLVDRLHTGLSTTDGVTAE